MRQLVSSIMGGLLAFSLISNCSQHIDNNNLREELAYTQDQAERLTLDIQPSDWHDIDYSSRIDSSDSSQMHAVAIGNYTTDEGTNVTVEHRFNTRSKSVDDFLDGKREMIVDLGLSSNTLMNSTWGYGRHIRGILENNGDYSVTIQSPNDSKSTKYSISDLRDSTISIMLSTMSGYSRAIDTDNVTCAQVYWDEDRADEKFANDSSKTQEVFSQIITGNVTDMETLFQDSEGRNSTKPSRLVFEPSDNSLYSHPITVWNYPQSAGGEGKVELNIRSTHLPHASGSYDSSPDSVMARIQEELK